MIKINLKVLLDILITLIKKKLQKLFKVFAYKLYFLFYGKITGFIKPNSDTRIAVNLVSINEDLKYKIFSIDKGRLYTDRVHDAAAIIDDKIIEDASFQLRNNRNSKIMDNIVFEKGTPRRLKKIDGTVLSLLTGGGGNYNYWHWLYDVLPRLKLCQEIKKLELVDFFLFPSLTKKFQLETLEKLQISKKKLLSSEKFRHIKTSNLIITDHPYNVTEDPHVDAQNIPQWIIEWLKENFISNKEIINKNYPQKIYIDRIDSTSNVAKYRSLVNEKEIKDILESDGYKSIILNELSFDEQVRHFNQAKSIIGLHGAGFANLTFCKSDTRVLEFKMHKTGKVIENLAKTNNLKYDAIECNAISHDEAKQLGHIKIPLNILREKIR